MILVGQFDSPYVRRVGVALHVYGLPFTRDKTSVFSASMARVHPLVRIPSLTLDDGEVLWDSAAILDYLDERVGPEVALMPRAGRARRDVMKATVLAVGATEKTGAVVYERHFHPVEHVATRWVERCLGQLAGALGELDRRAVASPRAPWLFERLTHADVMVGCLVDFLRARLAEAMPPSRYPALERLATQCEELAAFRQTRAAPDELMPPEGSGWERLGAS